tara:strand:+ start:114 stop:776 length:663 start_codon:yes stop_codon:yes gene_type:complete
MALAAAKTRKAVAKRKVAKPKVSKTVANLPKKRDRKAEAERRLAKEALIKSVTVATAKVKKRTVEEVAVEVVGEDVLGLTPEEDRVRAEDEVKRLLATLPAHVQESVFSSEILKKAYERTMEQLDASVTHFNPNSGTYTQYPDWGARDKAINRVFQHMFGLPIQKTVNLNKAKTEEGDVVDRLKDSPYAEKLLAEAGFVKLAPKPKPKKSKAKKKRLVRP